MTVRSRKKRRNSWSWMHRFVRWKRNCARNRRKVMASVVAAEVGVGAAVAMLVRKMPAQNR